MAVGCGAPAKPPSVIVETSMGDFKIELDPVSAPETVQNFLGYVDDKFYDGTIFHRVISNFMIQGGGFEPGLKEKPTKAPIKNEAANGLSNLRGTIAMARTNNPNSATAQFYINLVDNSQALDPRAGSAGYCVFGHVVDGMDVVDKIRRVETGTVVLDPVRKIEHENVPRQDVVIKSIRRAE
jgi:cyclophilin family peptidyl-prolyl cis-trans isomerase